MYYMHRIFYYRSNILIFKVKKKIQQALLAKAAVNELACKWRHGVVPVSVFGATG